MKSLWCAGPSSELVPRPRGAHIFASGEKIEGVARAVASLLAGVRHGRTR